MESELDLWQVIKKRWWIWLPLFLFAAPLAFYVITILPFNQNSRFIFKPIALLFFCVSQVFALIGGVGALIELHFTNWEILLGVSGIFTFFGIINLTLAKIWKYI